MRMLITEPLPEETLCGCDVYFDSYANNTYSVLTVGNLVSNNCVIDEYVIDWYRDSIANGIQLTTGKGSDTSILARHPLTGNASVPVQSGTWIPVLRYIVISGERIYATKRAGYQYCDLSSTPLPSINVNPIDCSTNVNGMTDYPFALTYIATEDYRNATRVFNFNLPSDGLTKYVAVYTYFESVADRVNVYLNDTSTLLESYIIGDRLIGNNYNNIPYEVDNHTLRLVINLTNISYGSGDYLRIEITPSIKEPTNYNTNWKIALACLPAGAFEDLFSGLGNHYRLFDLNSTNIQMTWDSVNCVYSLNFFMKNHLDSINTNLSKYLMDTYKYSNDTYFNRSTSEVTLWFLHNLDCSTATTVNNTPKDLNETVVYTKSGSTFTAVFTNLNDYNYFKSAYNTTLNHFRVVYYNLNNPTPAEIEYYTWFNITWKETLISCGDQGITRVAYFHIDSQVTWDDVNKTATINMVDAQSGYNTTECGDCNTVVSNALNTYKISSNDYVSETVCVRENPFGLSYVRSVSKTEWSKEFYFYYALQIPQLQNLFPNFNGWWEDTSVYVDNYKYYIFYLFVEFTSQNTSVPTSDPDHPVNNFRIKTIVDMSTGAKIVHPINYVTLYEINQGIVIVP